MTGHVFHPGHDALHGITVVVETAGSDVYVGRFDRQDDQGVHLIGVSVWNRDSQSKDTFIARTAKFGVRIDRPHLVVPTAQIAGITPLGSVAL